VNFATVSPQAWLEDKATTANAAGGVLLHAGTGVFQSPGGGEVQLVKTGMALEARGCAVGLFNPWRDRLAEARLVHLFGLHPEGETLARLAKSAGIGVVVSPICWYDPRAHWEMASGWIPGLAGWAKWGALRHAAPLRRRAWRSRLLHYADAVLPNSEAEADQIHRLLGIALSRLHVVPNAVDPADQPADRILTEHRFGTSDFVLYVGRIEPRKNVLGLIRACRDIAKPLVVVGDAPAEQADYLRQCRHAAGDVRFVGAMPKGDPLLESALATARVFALPSWFETPGLAALEAAAYGTPVAITVRGSTREYFGDAVAWCDPADPATIRAAIDEAWHRPSPARFALADRIRGEWTWPETARITEGIYDAVAP
jgi:glycosyltransferase involved in cell wall biosynthesis